MFGSFNAEIDQFWRLLNALIEWVAGGPVEPRMERLLDYFAVAAVFVVALVVVIVFDEIVKYAREESRRRQQEDWRQRVQERNQRISRRTRKSGVEHAEK